MKWPASSPTITPAIHRRRCERLNALGVTTDAVSLDQLRQALEHSGMVFSNNGATESSRAMSEIDEWLDAQEKDGKG